MMRRNLIERSGLNFAFVGAIVLLGTSVAAAQDPSSMPGQAAPGGTNMSQQSPGVKSQPTPPGDASGNTGGAPDTGLMRDKVFVMEVGEVAVAELQFGQLAAQKGSNDDVKKFGQKMVDDHNELVDLLKPMAASIEVKLPTKMNKADQTENDKLKGMSGPDFDKEFLTYIIAEHRHNLREYRDETQATNNAELRDAALNTAKVVGQHTREAMTVAKANGVTLPGPPPHQN
jgi:putative membrane protein